LPPIPILKGWRRKTRRVGKLTPHGTLGSSSPTVDALGRRRRVLVCLKANVIEKGFLGQGFFGNAGGFMRSCPPAYKMKQIVRITAERGIGKDIAVGSNL
jgi:hypothetical protein